MLDLSNSVNLFNGDCLEFMKDGLTAVKKNTKNHH